MENKTIAVISTPLGRGAISIVRMSGKNSLEIAKKVFKSKNLDYNKIQPRMLYFGKFDLENNLKENCLMVYFKSPNSYTGEDLVEFQVHGGTILTSKILSILLNNGAVLAENGEFSKRAFENGKISLDQAESIIGEINAESEAELKASLNMTDGRLKNKIKLMQNSLTEQLAEIEAVLDYPEEDFEDEVKEKIFDNIKVFKSDIENFLKECESSKYLKNGINVAIVGSPNVGKSSLLNSLIGRDRAIVTSIAGTTRDVLNESVSYKGIMLNFIDTAGIRESNDEVEKIGINKSINSIDEADVILHVIDGAREKNAQDEKIENLLNDKNNVITIINKIDCERIIPKQKNEIEISALKEINIDLIKDKIYKMVLDEDIDYSQVIILNERIENNLKESYEIVCSILNNETQSMDIISMLIKKLWNSLGKITGETENERIIDLIFSKFCLGK